MSKITLVLFVLSAICYLLSAAGIATALGAVAVIAEISMYVSMNKDSKDMDDNDTDA